VTVHDAVHKFIFTISNSDMFGLLCFHSSRRIAVQSFYEEFITLENSHVRNGLVKQAQQVGHRLWTTVKYKGFTVVVYRSGL